MIIFVDNEHEKGYETDWGERLLAARTRIKYRLEDITSEPCLIVRYNHVTPDLLQSLQVKAIFISGSGTDPDKYDADEQAGLKSVLKEQQYPTFGFCGGFQVMAEAFGVQVKPIGPLAAGVEDPQPKFAPGMIKEFGYQPVPLTGDHPLLAGLGDAPIMRQAHSWELKTMPENFSLYASTDVTPIQLAIHDTLPIIGTQFHPEYYTDEHPAGRILIENFCRQVGLCE
ncbi:MAG: gamma-glutamyl-gamma-aminobutyrate hydrolase family protein [Chloroflexota bacterium]